MKMYRTNSWEDRVEEFEVATANKSTVYYINKNGNPDTGRSTTKYHAWHKTKEDAVEFLILRNKNLIQNAENKIKEYQYNISLLENSILVNAS